MANDNLREFQKNFELLDDGSNIDTSIINPANFQQIVTVLLHNMKDDVPNGAHHACNALFFLARVCEEAGLSSSLTPFFREIVRSLMPLTRKEDPFAGKPLRSSAFSTLYEVVQASSTDETTASMVLELIPDILIELHHNILESDESERHGQLWLYLQSVMWKLASLEERNIEHAVMQYADQIMGLFVRVFACTRNVTVHKEAMLAVGALIDLIGPHFEKYMTEIYDYIQVGLQNFDEYELFIATICVVGGICGALHGKILPYCDGIMTPLMESLSSGQLLHRSVKPHLFICFGDIAMAVKESFENYVMDVMDTLKVEAAGLYAGIDDDDDEYTKCLRSGILEGYLGIFTGFFLSPNIQLLLPHAPHIIQFLDIIYLRKDMDDHVKEIAIGVLEIMADALGSDVISLIRQSVSGREFLRECLFSDNELIKENADWAASLIYPVVSV